MIAPPAITLSDLPSMALDERKHLPDVAAIVKRKAIAPATLARQWIAERLEVEREAARKGTQG